jgi:hypothetical protein
LIEELAQPLLVAPERWIDHVGRARPSCGDVLNGGCIEATLMTAAGPEDLRCWTDAAIGEHHSSNKCLTYFFVYYIWGEYHEY